MPVATLALMAALAVVPSSDTVQTQPVATCDMLTVNVENTGTKAIRLTPEVDGAELDAIRVRAGETVPYQVPGEPTRQLAFIATSGERLGPWTWSAPARCEGLQRDSGASPVVVQARTAALWWVFVIGLLMITIGGTALVNHRVRQYRYARGSAPVSHVHGRHRASEEGEPVTLPHRRRAKTAPWWRFRIRIERY